MAARPNLILVGLPGSGKTSIGRAAARALGWPFLDFDTEIEHRQHRSIEQIFAAEGEDYFRALEQELSREMAGCVGTVMSAGGGWVLNRESVALLRQCGRIIYLRASPELLVVRLATARVRRPLLAVADPLARLRELYAARAPLYEDADLVLDTENVDRKELIAEIQRYALSL